MKKLEKKSATQTENEYILIVNIVQNLLLTGQAIIKIKNITFVQCNVTQIIDEIICRKKNKIHMALAIQWKNG